MFHLCGSTVAPAEGEETTTQRVTLSAPTKTIAPCGHATPELPAVPADVEFLVGTFTNAQGIRLQTYSWSLVAPSKPPRGLVWLCHGYAVHIQFDWFRAAEPGGAHCAFAGTVVEALVRAGFVVHALDHQSMGRSGGGPRAFFRSFQHLPQEADTYLHEVVLKDARWAKLADRVFLWGVSMGGATALHMARRRPGSIRGCLLYSPMLSLDLIRKKSVLCCITNGHLEKVARPLSYVVPRLPVAKGAKNVMYPPSQKEMEEDALTYHGDVRSRVGWEFSKVCTEFMDGGGLREMRVPFITFHSVKDTFTDPYGSERLVEVAAATDKSHVKIGVGQDIQVDMFHGLANEPGCEKVLARAMQWITERCPRAHSEVQDSDLRAEEV